MKLHQKLVLGLSVLSTVATAQVNTAWQTTSPFIGIGIATTPSFNLHTHGTSDFSFTSKDGTVNYGKTARIGLTNTTSGSLLSDGGLIRMSDNNFNLINQETGTFNILSSGGNVQLNNNAGAAFTLSSTRAFVGSTSIGAGYNYGALNIQALNSDNGLFIKTLTAGKYGIAVKVAQDIEKALMVYGSSSTNVNFEVLGSGEVYARKYTTTLAAFPDYVFADNYSLLSFNDLRSYLKVNNRLPNMPSAVQVEKEGADLGELNRLLVEKVEELTLYILQLEERMQKVEKVN